MTLKKNWANGEQFNASDMNELATVADSAYVKPGTGIPASDLASAVQTSLGKADTAVQSVSSTNITDATTTGKNLLTALDSSAARTVIGVAYGTTAGTVCQGNDSRLSPSSTSITDATTVGKALLTATDAATARTTLGVAYGTTSTTVCVGNDSRVTGAEQTSNKDANNGYAGLNSSGKLVLSKLATTGTADSTTYLRGDGAWSTVTGGFTRSVSTITAPTTLGNAASTDYVTFLNNSASTDASYSSVQLLLPGNGANNSTSIVDYSSSARTVTVGGNAKISTTQSKFGGNSIVFAADGTDYLSVLHTSGFNLAGDFTVEAWVFLAADSSAYNMFISKGTGAGNRSWSINAGPSSIRFYYTTDGGTDVFITRSATLPTATWMHIAVVRSGSTLKIFKDGVQQGADATVSATFYVSSSSPLWLGRFMDYTGIGHSMNGYLDDVRISSTARYTSNFTAPTSEFVTVGTPTLPTAVSNTNQYTLKNISGSTLTVGTTSSQQIDGASSYSLTNNSAVNLMSDGSNWRSV